MYNELRITGMLQDDLHKASILSLCPLGGKLKKTGDKPREMGAYHECQS